MIPKRRIWAQAAFVMVGFLSVAVEFVACCGCRPTGSKPVHFLCFTGHRGQRQGPSWHRRADACSEEPEASLQVRGLPAPGTLERTPWRCPGWEPPLVTATKEMHSIHSKDGISKKLALHGRPETHWQGVNENGWDSVVRGQAAPVGQGERARRQVSSTAK